MGNKDVCTIKGTKRKPPVCEMEPRIIHRQNEINYNYSEKKKEEKKERKKKGLYFENFIQALE